MWSVSLAREQFLTGRVTGKPEVIGSSVGLVSTNALVSTNGVIPGGLANRELAGRLAATSVYRDELCAETPSIPPSPPNASDAVGVGPRGLRRWLNETPVLT
jgi:hypothetical protein